MVVTPRTMRGAMELLPPDQVAFQRMLDTIRGGFERFGFLPVETPVMEYVDVLLTKSGGETEKQVYFVQSTGNMQQGKAPDLALRFDLTVPLARYVAAHEGKLQFPFRRYQIQRVYRGEAAQRGRYREFYQCDIDVVGKDTLGLQYDAEIPMVIHHVFRELGIGAFTIHLNHRQVLIGFLDGLGVVDADQRGLALREVDKLDKVGPDKVRDMLVGDKVGLDAEVADRLLSLTTITGGNDDVLEQLRSASDAPAFQRAVEELAQIVALLRAGGVPDDDFRIDPKIARGLDYYTGAVYETLLDAHPEIGSICSGGRYEDLASHYTKSKLPGVGISIGATRLFYQMMELGLTKASRPLVDVVVTRMDEELAGEYVRIATILRAEGFNVELRQEGGKLGKQLKQVDQAKVPLAVVMGKDERERNSVQVKNMLTGSRRDVRLDDLVATVRGELAASDRSTDS